MKPNLTTSFKTGLLACAAAAAVTSTQAQTQSLGSLYARGDLIAGFTTGSGNDIIFNLGLTSSELVNGYSWNLNSLLLGNYGNLNNLQWGVIGLSSGNFVLKSSTIYTTSSSAAAIPAPNYGANEFNAQDTDGSTIGGNIGSGGYGTDPVNDVQGTSWYENTVVGTTGWATDYCAPNATTTPLNFSSGSVSETFYASVIGSTSNHGTTSLNGTFTLGANGILTYNVASTTPAPIAGFAANLTAGFAPLTVVFTNASTGSITNWLWNFGNGHSITNATSSSVTNIYTTAGKYTVSLQVMGPGGANTSTMANYIIVSPVPQLGNVTLSGGQLVFGGANGPAGVQYRILSSTNLNVPLASWTPVLTNAFASNGSYSYTNSATTNSQTFYRLVSP